MVINTGSLCQCSLCVTDYLVAFITIFAFKNDRIFFSDLQYFYSTVA